MPREPRTPPPERGAPAGGPDDDRARATAALEEELGDLLFQVYFHARLASEAGRFTLADVARGIHDKLVDRHPHVFGDEDAPTAEDVAANWEVRKLAEKKRTSVTEGIPGAMPALALTAKLQRKALAVGMTLPSLADEAEKVVGQVAALGTTEAPGDGGEISGGRLTRLWARCCSSWCRWPAPSASTRRRPSGRVRTPFGRTSKHWADRRHPSSRTRCFGAKSQVAS